MKATYETDSVAYYKANYASLIAQNSSLLKFIEKSGFNSLYAHSCGNMDGFRFGDFYLTLELDCHWHVRVSYLYKPQLKWETLDSRPEAKRLFLHLRRMIKNGASLEQIENAYI